ncbi:Uncharacterised protein [Vibrio cholerae]|nr:Uncharacterised protein [Vibrio cholerae]
MQSDRAHETRHLLSIAIEQGMFTDQQHRSEFGDRQFGKSLWLHHITTHQLINQIRRNLV